MLFSISFLCLISAFLVAPIQATHFDLGPYYCMENNPINLDKAGSVCTANDIRIAQILNQGPATTCVVGQVTNINMKANFVATAQTRYAVGSYIALDGGDAYTGTCYGYTLHPVGSPTNFGTGDFNSFADGPFGNYDGDLCGDTQQGDVIWQTIRNVSFICRDTNADGVADVGTCLSWSNQVVGTCTDIRSAPLRTKSKCNCGSVNIVGLTVCLSAQKVCYGNDGNANTFPCEPEFSARFRVTSSSTSKMFPPSSVLYGNVYFNFQTNNQTLGLSYFDQTQMPSQFFTSNPTVVREDILWPCKTQQRTVCGSTCTVVYNNNWIPRLFHEGNYAVNTLTGRTLPDGSCTGAPALPFVLPSGFNCYQKTVPTGAPGEYIKYIWAKLDAANRYEVGAAVSLDGTIWELFTETGQYGVILGTSQTTSPGTSCPPQLPFTSTTTCYDFTKYDGQNCGTLSCTAPVEVAFSVDEQSTVSTSGFTLNYKSYINATIAGFSPATTTSRFGIGWANNNGAAGRVPALTAPSNLIADRTSLQNYITARTQAGGTTDFAELITTTINTYWPAAPGSTSPPRFLIVLVGGADSPTSGTTWASVQTLYTTRSVTVWAIGIGAGSSQTTLLNNIASNSNNIMTWTSETLLNSDNDYMWRRLCPANTPLCPCGGFCTCAGSSTSCTCPASCNSLDACNPTSCVNPSTGCTVDPGLALNCQGTNPCLNYPPCVDSNGITVAGGTASCPTPTAKTCTTTDMCLTAYCDSSNLTQPCQTTAKVPNPCNDGNACTTDTCFNNQCTYTPIPFSAATPNCGTNPCFTGICQTDPTTCIVQTCMTSVTQCATLTGAQNTACLSAFTTAGYYCAQTPKTCPAGDACTSYSCVNGNCVATSTTCNDGNKCTIDTCDATTGCKYTPMTQSQVDTLCQPASCQNATCSNNVCTLTNITTGICAPGQTDPCAGTNPCGASTFCTQQVCINSLAGCSTYGNPTGCTTAIGNNQKFCYAVPTNVCPTSTACTKYTCVDATSSCTATQTTCTAPNICQTASCNPSTGCVYTPLTSAQEAALCNDNNACTADKCDSVSNQCKYTPLTTAACTNCNTPSVVASCTTSNKCSPKFCYDASTGCTDTNLLSSSSCSSNVTANGFYCETRPVTCTSDACSTRTCDTTTGTCKSTAVNCPSPNACQQALCVLPGGCTTKDPCVGAIIPDLCREAKCTLNASAANGYTCYDPTSAVKDCSDYICKATGLTTPVTVIGTAAKNQFLSVYASANPSCQAVACTTDSCSAGTGCSNSQIYCATNPGGCNATLGCFEAGNPYNFPPGVCQQQLIASLIDFCGTCRGSNIACFVANVNNAAVAGGIAAGVVAGIVVACVVAALLAAYLSKKGYDYYKAQSDLASTGLNNNPAFQEANNIGSMPDSS